MTEELAGFLAASRWQDIPAEIRREGGRAILNIAGCVVAGRQDPGVGILAKTRPDSLSIRRSTFVMSITRLPAPSATIYF